MDQNKQRTKTQTAKRPTGEGGAQRDARQSRKDRALVPARKATAAKTAGNNGCGEGVGAEKHRSGAVGGHTTRRSRVENGVEGPPTQDMEPPCEPASASR